MKRFQFLMGFLCGALLFAGITSAASAASGLMAAPSKQAIYVDGQQVSMTAYNIAGNNYVKLRDIGEAVGFNVYWDGSVQIESDKPYTGVAPASQTTPPTQQTPDALTEESVQAAIRALRDTYPSGTYYGAFYRSNSNGPYGMAPSNCAGWATLCSDAAFNDLPWQQIESPAWAQIRAGDLVRFDNSDGGGHVVVVVEKTEDYIKVTESGTNNKVRWGGQYFKWWLEEQSGYALRIRYPQ